MTKSWSGISSPPTFRRDRLSSAGPRNAARRGRLRVPERLLHLLAVLGGTPSAWLAQRTFRHKTIKGPFRIAFWAIAILQAVGIGLWVYYA